MKKFKIWEKSTKFMHESLEHLCIGFNEDLSLGDEDLIFLQYSNLS